MPLFYKSDMGGHSAFDRSQRYSVSEAASKLGISQSAVRRRIKAGALTAEREKRRLWVLLPAELTQDAPETSYAIIPSRPAPLALPDQDPSDTSTALLRSQAPLSDHLARLRESDSSVLASHGNQELAAIQREQSKALVPTQHHAQSTALTPVHDRPRRQQTAADIDRLRIAAQRISEPEPPAQPNTRRLPAAIWISGAMLLVIGVVAFFLYTSGFVAAF